MSPPTERPTEQPTPPGRRSKPPPTATRKRRRESRTRAARVAEQEFLAWRHATQAPPALQAAAPRARRRNQRPGTADSCRISRRLSRWHARARGRAPVRLRAAPAPRRAPLRDLHSESIKTHRTAAGRCAAESPGDGATPPPGNSPPASVPQMPRECCTACDSIPSEVHDDAAVVEAAEVAVRG